MIGTLKRKFILTAMIAVTVLLVTLLGALNVVNAWSTCRDTDRLLEDLLQMELSGRPELPDGKEPPEPPAEEAPEKPDGQLSWREGRRGGFMAETLTENDRRAAVYLTVLLQDGEMIGCDLSRISDVTEEEAEALAAQALASGKSEGQTEGYRYISGQNRQGQTMFVFLNNSTRRNAVLRVMALSGLAGLGGWLLMLGLVVLLSKRTIAPIAENMERQRQFVTDAGHELKTPLAIIQANTEAMELIAGENKWSRNIRAQTERLTELTRNLLTLARADEVPVLGKLSPVDLSALTEKTVQMFQTPMDRKNLSLEMKTEPHVTVRGSETLLGNLLSILVDNAVKYALAGSTLRLSLRTGEKTCTLRLENCCEQLPDCPPERLFDRFYRSDAARTRSSGGFGIGLSAAQVITLQHRGRLEAEYPAEDRIAFTVTLPTA